MKSVLYNFYGFSIDNIVKDKNKYFFEYNNISYMFMKVDNDLKVVEKIYNYCVNNKIKIYKIILNKDGELFSKFDNNSYSLLELSGINNYIVEFNEFTFFPIDGDHINWGELWGNKIDYYEVQVRELALKYQDLINSFAFFSGLAENAILYYNLSIRNFEDEKQLSIVHNRVKYPNYLINYMNPLELVIDYYVRDIAEYVKSYIFSNTYNINKVFEYLDSISFNNLSFNLFYSRLLFPTFYFDLYDEIILDNYEEKGIFVIINKINIYVNTLREIFIRYSSKYNMFNIMWINKKSRN